MFGLKKAAQEFISGPDFPTENWLLWANRTAEFTPDFAQLEQKVGHLLFVCDLFKDGFSEHDTLGPSVFCGTAYTRERFHFWKKNLSSSTYPVPVRPEQGKEFKDPPLWSHQRECPPAKILGELYFVPSRQFLELDKARYNTLSYSRRRVKVDITYYEKKFVKDRHKLENVVGYPVQRSRIIDPTEKIQTVECWMYIGRQKFWNSLIDGGYYFSPCALHYPEDLKKHEKYYKFTRDELPR